MLKVLYICGGYTVGVEGAFNRRLSTELLETDIQLDFLFLWEKQTPELITDISPHRIVESFDPREQSNPLWKRGIQRLVGPVQSFLIPETVMKRLETAVLESDKVQKYQLIVSRYLPFQSACLGFYFKRLLNIPWVGLFFDQFPAHIHPDIAGYNKTRRFITPIAKRRWEEYAKIVYQTADRIIFPSRPLYEYVFSHLDLIDPEMSQKVNIIEHLGVRPDTVRGDLANDKSEFRILHLGSILWGRNPQGLIDAWQAFIRDLSPQGASACKLELIGEIEQDVLNKLMQQQLHKSIHITTDRISPDDALKNLLDSTVAVLLDAYAKPNIFVAGKLAEYYTLGKPILVLSPLGSASRQLLKEDSFSYFAEPGDAKTIQSHLRDLYLHWKSSDNLASQNIISKRKNLFDPKNVATRYVEIFSSVTGERGLR